MQFWQIVERPPAHGHEKTRVGEWQEVTFQFQLGINNTAWLLDEAKKHSWENKGEVLTEWDETEKAYKVLLRRLLKQGATYRLYKRFGG